MSASSVSRLRAFSLRAMDCCCCERLEWFWVRKGLLFPNPEREQAFFDYQTQGTIGAKALRYFVGACCFSLAVVAAAIESLHLISLFAHHAQETDNGLFLRDGSMLAAAVSIVLYVVGVLCLLVSGASAVWHGRHRKTVFAAGLLLVLWEASFLARSVFEIFGLSFGFGLPIAGPVYPFDKLLLGGDAYGGAVTSYATLAGNPACIQNVTHSLLILNTSCTFNLTTSSEVMMYAGYTDGFADIFPWLGVPWAIVVVLAASNFVFPARQFFWLALLPLTTLLLIAGALLSPVSNMNFLDSIVLLSGSAGDDQTIGYIFVMTAITCITFFTSACLISFNLSYLHERTVREMYFWTDFTRIRRDQLSTQNNPFTAERIIKWLRRHSQEPRSSPANSLSQDDEYQNTHAGGGGGGSGGGGGGGGGSNSSSRGNNSHNNYWEIDPSAVNLIIKKAGGASGTVWQAQYQGRPAAAKASRLAQWYC